jgi:hypothetical protein
LIQSICDPIKLLRALVGVASVAGSPGWQQSAKKLVETLSDAEQSEVESKDLGPFGPAKECGGQGRD